MVKILSKSKLTVFLTVAATVGWGRTLTPNLVRDGGMETWREVRPEESLYNTLDKLQVSYTDIRSILMPSTYEQGAVAVVRRESTDVASGSYSVRLKANSFYMFGAFESAYEAKRGDVYVARFMAKGQGNATIYLTVYGGGAAYTIEQKGTPVQDRWTQIEQRILVGGTSPDRIYPRLSTSAEMLIDDVFVGRVLREDEASATQKVSKQYDACIAFAPEAVTAPAIDGKLEEDCWKTAIPFSGFRTTQDQTQLAAEQTSFRMLYDQTAIYLGVEVPLADAERVLADLKTRPLEAHLTGDVYSSRHSVEIFLQPPGQSRYVQYVISLDGRRFDCTGLRKSDLDWTGQWTCGIRAEKDRWYLEVKIPASDLNLKTIPSAEGWRLNVVDNREGTYATWAAVGNNFHNPFSFGMLVTQDFPLWRSEKHKEWAALREKLTEQDHGQGRNFKDRLERAQKFSEALLAPVDKKQIDWQAITRAYILMSFVDTAYRTMEREDFYIRLFTKN